MSLSPTLSFAEVDGTVQVCAMLSIASPGTATANDVTIMLATSDIIPGNINVIAIFRLVR